MSSFHDYFVQYYTKNKGNYLSTAMEDLAIGQALKNLDKQNKVSFKRLLVLRGISDLDSPYTGQSAEDSLENFEKSGAMEDSIKNLFLAGNAIMQDILSHPKEWEKVSRK